MILIQASKTILFLTVWLITLILMAGCQQVNIINTKYFYEHQQRGKGKIHFKKQPIVYSLPQNVIRVKVKTEKHNVIAGPYAIWAEKYLGIKNVPLKDTCTWRISNINFSSYSVPDPDHFYLVESNGRSVLNKISLSEKGTILSINEAKSNNKPAINTELTIGKQTRVVNYTDLTTKNNFAEKKDTLFKTIKTDSSFYRIPVYKIVLSKKTEEEKADEAAKLILELREVKVSLLTGENDKYPDGITISTAIDELNILEANYLGLFIGKSFTDTATTFFEYLPAKERKNEDTLFFFSPETGIVSNDALGCDPVIIKIMNPEKTGSLKPYLSKIDSIFQRHDGIYYRIPEEADVQLFRGDQKIAGSKMILSQLGEVLILPYGILKDKSTVIEFYPETGGIMNIYKK